MAAPATFSQREVETQEPTADSALPPHPPLSLPPPALAPTPAIAVSVGAGAGASAGLATEQKVVSTSVTAAAVVTGAAVGAVSTGIAPSVTTGVAPGVKKVNSNPIKLIFKLQDGREVVVTMNKTSPFRKAFQAIGGKDGRDPNSLRFLFDGTRLQATDTPAGREMEDEDTVDVMENQVGGGRGGGADLSVDNPADPFQYPLTFPGIAGFCIASIFGNSDTLTVNQTRLMWVALFLCTVAIFVGASYRI